MDSKPLPANIPLMSVTFERSAPEKSTSFKLSALLNTPLIRVRLRASTSEKATDVRLLSPAKIESMDSTLRMFIPDIFTVFNFERPENAPLIPVALLASTPERFTCSRL